MIQTIYSYVESAGELTIWHGNEFQILTTRLVK